MKYNPKINLISSVIVFSLLLLSIKDKSIALTFGIPILGLSLAYYFIYIIRRKKNISR